MYTHTEEHKKELSEMSNETKKDRLTLKNIRSRDPFHIETEYWIIANNDYPYVWVKEHITVWAKDVTNWKEPRDIAWVEFWKIATAYPDHNKIINGIKKMSCISRFHFHLVLDK